MRIPDDPFVRELLPEFIATWIRDLQTGFDELVRAHDSQEIFRIGHTLKGSCYQFGLDEIAELAIEMMDLANGRDWSGVKRTKTKILQLFVEVGQEALGKT